MFFRLLTIQIVKYIFEIAFLLLLADLPKVEAEVHFYKKTMINNIFIDLKSLYLYWSNKILGQFLINSDRILFKFKIIQYSEQNNSDWFWCKISTKYLKYGLDK